MTSEILGHIDELIRTEHELRGQVADGKLPSNEEQARLRSVEESLDQCWDLLRQAPRPPRVRREPDGDAAQPAPPPEVEGYMQ